MNRALPQPNAADRLGIAIFFAAIAHGILILGVAFGERLVPRSDTPPTLDVVLVRTQSPDAPQDAEHIAQAHQQASGSGQEKARPSAPVSAPYPDITDGNAPLRATPTAPPPQPDEPQRVLTAEAAVVATPPSEDREKTAPREAKIADLVEQTLALSRMISELREQDVRETLGPRAHYLDAVSTKSVVEAAYVDAWVKKVERVGNLNYPDEARRRQLSGSLVLNVILDRDGRVLGMDLLASSGERVLDDAARRIVQLASPFAAFPPEMRERYDRLTISRTWVFGSERITTTR